MKVKVNTYVLATFVCHRPVYKKIVEVYGSTGTISPFGERFRGGENTLVSFLFAPCCSTCPAICKSTDTPPCPVVPDPLSGARPFGDGVGSGHLRDGNPSIWYGVLCPRSQLFVKMGAHAAVPYMGSATL